LYNDFSKLYESKSNGMYYYYVGKYKTEEIATKFQEFLKNNGVESTVVEYKLGRRRATE
jgi:cell division protein FtsN